jgi:hypothetical protein
MSRVISKQEVNQWTDKHKVDDMKHQRVLRDEATPKPMFQMKGGRGRTTKTRTRPKREHSQSITPQRIQSILSNFNGSQTTTSSSYSRPPPPQNAYREYKDSIKKTGTHFIASYAGSSNTDNVREKLQNSEDIQKIINNKIGDLDFVGDNEWGILGLTVLGKFLEAKFGV